MDHQELLAEKAQLRESARRIRDGISQADRERQNKVLFSMITSTEMYENAQYILTYVSCGSEVDTKDLIKKAVRDGKRVYAPKTFGGGQMEFYEVEELGQLKRNSIGILEPDGNPSRAFPYQMHISMDRAEQCLIFVPGLLFDAKLGRLGAGGGYYDRYLKRFRKKMAVGLSFNEQIAERVPMGDDDETMDLIVTPQRAYF